MKQRISSLPRLLSQRGFGMVELLVAIVVFSFVVIAVSSLFGFINHVQTATNYQETATRAAQRQIETLRNNNFVQLTPGDEIDFADQVTDILPQGTTAVASISEPSSGLRRVDVTIQYPLGSDSKTVEVSSLIGEIGLTQ